MLRILASAFLCCLLSACAGHTDGVARYAGFEEGREMPLDAPPFRKWNAARARIEAAGKVIWPRADFARLPPAALAEKVNEAINAYPYIADAGDRWDTPAEFFRRGGGDCEEYAIAKYLWLRELGVPEERLRLSVVHDRYRGATHMVVVFLAGREQLILDNQITKPRDTAALLRYRPLYSLNAVGGWVHI